MSRKQRQPIFTEISSIDDCLAPILELGKKKFGDDRVYTGKESEARLVGLKLPALCLRYLFQLNVFPLSRMLQITGTQESCKSAFLYELYRWFRCNRGKAYHIENETKDSDTLRMSLLNYDREAVGLFISESLEDWMKTVTWLLSTKDGLKAKLLGTKDKPGPGKSVPLILGVDSLMAKSSMESIEKIEAEGFTDRAFPIDALKISSYLKFMPQKLSGWPFVFAATNHLKPQKSRTGVIEYNVPGGFSVKFQETFELRLSRVKDIESVNRPGVTVKFVTAKNSLGPSRKQILANMRWYFDRDDEYRQKTYWDWNSASIHLLDTFKGSIRKDLEDVCDISVVPVSGKGKYIWSKALDIPRSDPQPASHAGAVLEQREDLLVELHKILGVRTYSSFMPGVCYDQQLADASSAVEIAEGYAADHHDGEPDEGTDQAEVAGGLAE